MKAITYSKYWPPEVLQLKDMVKPVPKDDEILIKVRAAEATKSDCEMRSFKYSVKWLLAASSNRARRKKAEAADTS